MMMLVTMGITKLVKKIRKSRVSTKSIVCVKRLYNLHNFVLMGVDGYITQRCLFFNFLLIYVNLLLPFKIKQEEIPFMPIIFRIRHIHNIDKG